MNIIVLVIVLVMLVAGILGGLVNSFLADPIDDESKESKENKMFWWKHVTLGIAASFMVPLFLSMIPEGGNYIDKIKGVNDYPKLFVLAGFCLVAAVSSRAFIRSLSERVLKEVKSANKNATEAKEDAAEAKAAVAPLIEPEDVPDKLDALVSSSGPVTNVNEAAVLKTMVNGPYSLRSITGIAKDSSLTKAVVNSTLSSLIDKGLVAQAESKTGQLRWFATPEGRAIRLKADAKIVSTVTATLG